MTKQTLPLTELEAYKEIVGSTFTLQLNMNDAFHWACADSEDLPADDVKRIVHVVQKFGWDALLAFAAISRGYDSEHKDLLTPEYWAAKAELQVLADEGRILFEQWYEREEKKIEQSLFGGQEIVWKPAPERIWDLRKRLTGDNSRCVVQTARLADGLMAAGTTISGTRKRLLKKYNAKHGIVDQRCEFPDGDMTKPCLGCHLLGKYTGGGRTGDDLDCWPAVKIKKEIDNDEAPEPQPQIERRKKTWWQRLIWPF